MGLSKKALSEIYRPVGPKSVISGSPWTSGGGLQVTGQVDLSVPIRALKFKLKGRCVIGTAGFASVTPEGFLNLISRIVIQGVNARQQGNVTLWDIDFATAYMMSYLFAYRGGGNYSINSGTGETNLARPTTPIPATYNPVGATGTYDFRMSLILPFHPHEANAHGKQPLVVPGFLVRNEEWKDTISIQLTYGAQAGAGAVGVLGTSAGTTTVAFSGYGGVGANPTLDIESLPVFMGLDQKDLTVPGVLSRVQTPLNVVLQNAGTNIPLANLQKQPTPRVLFKVGVNAAGAPTAFTALSDTNVTTIGIQLGGNRNVRNKLDIFSYKDHIIDIYDTDPIAGYTLMDFIEQGNPDSSFPGQDIGDGATFQLVGDVTGVANAAGLVVQEQMLHAPAGSLYAGG